MKRLLTLAAVGVLPLLDFLAGFTAAGVYGFGAIPRLFVETARGMVPDGYTTKLDDVGTYTLWLQVRGQEDGVFHRGPESLPPGARIYLFDQASGQEVSVSKWIDAEKNIGHERAVSLGTFKGERPGQLVEVRGTGLLRPVLISISPLDNGTVLSVLVTLVGIIMASLIVAILLLLFLVERRAGKPVKELK